MMVEYRARSDLFSAALLRHLPGGQVLLTTAGPLPDLAEPERVLRVERGKLVG